jgi:hypothetical protein
MSDVLHHVDTTYKRCTEEILRQGREKFGCVFEIARAGKEPVLYVPSTGKWAEIQVYRETARADQTLDGTEKTVWTMRVFDSQVRKAMKPSKKSSKSRSCAVQ